MRQVSSPWGLLPDGWKLSTIKKEMIVVTDYVANGSFASLAENVQYSNTEEYAILIRLYDYNNNFSGNFVYVNEHAYNFLSKSKLYGDEIIISNVGANVGTVFKCPRLSKPMTLGPNSIVVKLNGNNDFYFYWFKSRYGKYCLDSIVSGSAQPKFNKTHFKEMPIPVPPLVEQEKIASILSALDNKIAVNRRICANLEAQAEALFKSWFVDFTPFKDQPFVDSELGPIPQGWKVGKLGDIALQSTEKVLTRNDVKVLSPITTGKLVLSEEYFTKQVFSKSIRNYKIVKQGAFAYNPARVNIGSLGMNEFKFDGCVSPVYVVFECLKGYSFFFDLFRKTEFFKQAVISFAIGGVRQTLNYSDFALIDATIPPLNIVQSFNEIYLHLKKKISINEEENQRLAALRDTLLPKLMSGEIKL